jgi:predicted O-methyltransferase YrrM
MRFLIVNPNFLPLAIGALAAINVCRADFRRRDLSFTRLRRQRPLTFLDLAGAAILAFGAGAALVLWVQFGGVPDSPALWGLASIAILAFVWSEGRRQIQFQRPAGIVFGETTILIGVLIVAESLLFHGNAPISVGAIGVGVGVIVVGGVTVAVIVPPFVKGYEGHRILEHIEKQGETVQAEYMPATHECPHPERWKMLDSQTSELEVLDFLKSIVMTVKPELIVETGTFIGYSSIKMAEGLKANGFGKIITIEFDPAIFAKAKERIDASGLGDWIEYRNASSLESTIDGRIDIFFSDSHLPIREDEIRRFLPQINPQGLILVHDASSHFAVVRDAVLRLEAEGLISTVLLSTPRGLVVAQKRDGRK